MRLITFISFGYTELNLRHIHHETDYIHLVTQNSTSDISTMRLITFISFGYTELNLRHIHHESYYIHFI